MAAFDELWGGRAGDPVSSPRYDVAASPDRPSFAPAPVETPPTKAELV